MRRPIIVVFLSLFLLAFAAGAAERGALFKVTAEGHTLHLYGTIHAGKPEYYPLEPRIREAVLAAPTLALEIDAMRDPLAIAQALSRHARFPEGSPGIAGLNPDRRQRIEAGLKQQGIDPAAFPGVKPWMLAMSLALVDAAKLGYSPALGVDQHLAQLARDNPARRTRIAELETVAYQAGLLNRLPDEEQWQMLEEALANMASGRQLREARELFAAYDSADQETLAAVARRIDSDDSVGGAYLRKVMLDERNGPMADKIAALLAREDKAVVAVGLLHLLGPRGIPELLRKRGIKVERVY